MKYIPGKVLVNLNVAKSKIHGLGAYATTSIPARRKLGEFNGAIISVRTARQRAKDRHSISIVELHNGLALDASQNRNALVYINHSCQPNCYLRIINFLVEIYTLKPIDPGEELTCDYGETHHKGGMKCRCRSEKCRDRV